MTRRFLTALVACGVVGLGCGCPHSAGAPGLPDAHLGIHSFVSPFFNTCPKTYLFDAAKRTGKSIIRFDVLMSSIELKAGSYTWAQTDENVHLAQQRGLTILGTINGTAPWVSTTSTPHHGLQGPVVDYAGWVQYVQAVVQHYPEITDWEVWNEPDTGTAFAFDGTASDYAHLLSVTYDAIHAVSSNAKVLFGGVTPGAFQTNGSSPSWMSQVLYDPSYPCLNKFDIGNVHLRDTVAIVTQETTNFRQVLNAIGRPDAPIWVTEHGYAADPQFQVDPNYRGTDLATGEQAQAAYYRASLPGMIGAGAQMVFVTLRDEAAEETQGASVPWTTEGMVTFAHTSDDTGRDRPSLGAFQQL